jgi:hypothetical protein
MKKRLLATTALAAAGLWSATDAALAQQLVRAGPIDITVSGYHEQMFGFATNQSNRAYVGAASSPNDHVLAIFTPGGTTNRPNRTAQYSDSEIWFLAKTTLANGLTIGMDVQLEANTATTGDQIDESYLYVDGSFGRLVLGSENDAAYIMIAGYAAPGANRAPGVNESAVTGSFVLIPANVSSLDAAYPKVVSLSSAGLRNKGSQNGNDYQRITYYTPRMVGFQLGGSYTPGTIEDINSVVDRRDTAYRTNAWSGAINYVNTFGSFRVAAAAGGSYYPKVVGQLASAAAGNKIIDTAYAVQLGFGPFEIGGAFRNNRHAQHATDGRAWSGGVRYQSGPIAVAGQWLSSKVDGLTTNSNSDKFDLGMVAADYTLAPGVELVGAVFYHRSKDEAGAAVNGNKGYGAVAGLHLRF